MGNLLFFAVVIALIYFLTSNFGKNPQNLSWLRGGGMFDEAKYLVSLLAKVAKSDGRVNELEANLISDILDDIAFKLGGDAVKRAELKQIYNQEKENLSNAYSVAREYYDKFGLDKDQAIAKISFLLNLAYIDGNLSRDERIVIEQIAIGMRVNRAILEALIAKFSKFYSQREHEKNGSYDGRQSRGGGQSGAQTNAKSPYAVLELTDGAAFDEVKKRYRELVKKYHPDILMGRGESEEIIEKSTRKLQEINEAYEIIKQKLGEK